MLPCHPVPFLRQKWGPRAIAPWGMIFRIYTVIVSLVKTVLCDGQVELSGSKICTSIVNSAVYMIFMHHILYNYIETKNFQCTCIHIYCISIILCTGSSTDQLVGVQKNHSTSLPFENTSGSFQSSISSPGCFSRRQLCGPFFCCLL